MLIQLLKTGAYQELHIYLGNVIIGTNGISVFDTVVGSSMGETVALHKIGQTQHCTMYERLIQ